MKKQPRILMLGGSAQQCPVISRAKEMGIYTVLCDYLPDNPGRLIADKYYPCSTTDVEAVYEVAKREEVDGILAYASDPAALPAAIVCERLGLPTNPVSAVETLSLKHKFRQFQKENDFPHPNFVAFRVDETPDLSRLHYPLIIKPTDSSGSKGVTVVYEPEQVQQSVANASQYTRCGILIAEEFINIKEPFILECELFVIDGEIVVSGDLECLRENNINPLVPKGWVAPTSLPRRKIRLAHQALQQMIIRTGFKTSEINAEIILSRNKNNNSVVIIEAGPRAGGNMLPQFVSRLQSVDLLSANIVAALGGRPLMTPQQSDTIQVLYAIGSDRSGIFSKVEIHPPLDRYLRDIILYREPGTFVERFELATNVIGYATFSIPDQDTMHKIIPNLYKIKPVLQ